MFRSRFGFRRGLFEGHSCLLAENILSKRTLPKQPSQVLATVYNAGYLDTVIIREVKDDVPSAGHCVTTHPDSELVSGYTHIGLIGQDLKPLIQASELPVCYFFIGYLMIVVPYSIQVAYGGRRNAIGIHASVEESLFGSPSLASATFYVVEEFVQGFVRVF